MLQFSVDPFGNRLCLIVDGEVKKAEVQKHFEFLQLEEEADLL